ncbi:MAG: DMT family transporter [Anaerolineaceae bacterium]|nr:DMT family transporter [Anaerolineaceae bacterium]
MTDKTDRKNSPYLLLVVGILAVSTAAILIKLTLPFASPLAIAFYRLLFSAIIAVLILLVSKRGQGQKIEREWIGLLLLSGLLLAAHFALWTWSLDLVSVNSSVIFTTTSPLWVGLLSPLILKEKVPKRFFTGVLFALVGGILIAVLGNSHSEKSTLPGLLTALLSAWMVAGYLLVGRKLAEKMATELYVSIVYSVAAVVLGALPLLIEKGFQTYQPAVYVYFILMALVPQTLGHTSFNKALKLLPARTVSLALLFEPVGSSILVMLLLKELPTAVEIAGGILILIGLFIALSAGAAEVNEA